MFIKARLPCFFAVDVMLTWTVRSGIVGDYQWLIGCFTHIFAATHFGRSSLISKEASVYTTEHLRPIC